MSLSRRGFLAGLAALVAAPAALLAAKPKRPMILYSYGAAPVGPIRWSALEPLDDWKTGTAFYLAG